MTQLADAFVDALGKLEQDSDVDQLVALYPSDAVAGDVPRPDEFEGPDGVRAFWTA